MIPPATYILCKGQSYQLYCRFHRQQQLTYAQKICIVLISPCFKIVIVQRFPIYFKIRSPGKIEITGASMSLWLIHNLIFGVRGGGADLRTFKMCLHFISPFSGCTYQSLYIYIYIFPFIIRNLRMTSKFPFARYGNLPIVDNVSCNHKIELP